ncbi:MAG: hypothetical protein QOD26_1416 [Betaproteobacteria bacterium]|jgi:uncharacterized caspase-like protein|nr:hypothetical protein [Betaproteobacteria bacterium]
MSDPDRRRLLQAGLALPFARWSGAWAQTPDRNLVAGERKEGSGVAAGGAPLLIAPRRALVIGNSSYGFGPLKNPANDAKAIGDALRASGFDVTTGLDLSRQQMLEAIRAYGESLTRAKAIGIFYFAGHGVQLAWRNYLLPIDAEIRRIEDIEARCVDVNAVIEGIAKAANPMNVVILDACRENPFAGVKLEQKGLSQLDAPPATLLAYATAPGNLASDGDGANGLYTEQLLKEIKVPEAKIEDVFKRVRLTVRRRSNGAQIPWESTSLEEDFWFIPPKEMQKLAAAEAERVRKEREAERLWQERIEKAQREETERLRREAEAEKARQEKIALAQREEAERLRREAEAERVKQEQIAKARREEAERLQREADAQRARQEADERRRHEQLARIYKEEQERRRTQEESDRAYEEELKFWERVSVSAEPAPLEEYLRRYPSGRFCEIAQAQLDAILAGMGEQKIQVAQQSQNPYTQGTARADIAYKVGDRYRFQVMDIYSKVVSREMNHRVTAVTANEVIYNDGRVTTDLLGNVKQSGESVTFTSNQQFPAEFFLGKRWRTRFEALGGQRGDQRFDVAFKITRKEQVTVPAGTFNTFRIDGSGTFIRGTRLVRVITRVWFAPDQVRRPVAREEIRTAGRGFEGRAERIELVSFRQG